MNTVVLEVRSLTRTLADVEHAMKVGRGDREARSETDASGSDAPAAVAKADEARSEPPPPKADEARSEPPPEPRPVKTRATPPPPPAQEDDATPLSTRDLELEPVSLIEIGQILAPGKTPPKMSQKLVPSVKLRARHA